MDIKTTERARATRSRSRLRFLIHASNYHDRKIESRGDGSKPSIFKYQSDHFSLEKYYTCDVFLIPGRATFEKFVKAACAGLIYVCVFNYFPMFVAISARPAKDNKQLAVGIFYNITQHDPDQARGIQVLYFPHSVHIYLYIYTQTRYISTYTHADPL
jgi:hypothetical protein